MRLWTILSPVDGLDIMNYLADYVEISPINEKGTFEVTGFKVVGPRWIPSFWHDDEILWHVAEAVVVVCDASVQYNS